MRKLKWRMRIPNLLEIILRIDIGSHQKIVTPQTPKKIQPEDKQDKKQSHD